MKLGLSACMNQNDYGRWEEARYKKLRAHGFDCVDLDLSKTDTEFYADPDRILEEKRLADAAGIAFSQVHGPWRWPSRDLTEEDRAERLEKMKLSMAMTAKLGCKYWVIHPLFPFGGAVTGKEAEQTVALTRTFMKKLLAEAKKYDVIICFENMPMHPFPLSTAQQTLDFVEEFHDDHLAICFDTGHAAIFHDSSVGDQLRLLGKYVKVLHVHDNDGIYDRHAYPFSGVIDWADFSKALQDVGYEGVLSLETLPSKDLPNDQYEAECRILNQLAKKLAP